MAANSRPEDFVCFDDRHVLRSRTDLDDGHTREQLLPVSARLVARNDDIVVALQIRDTVRPRPRLERLLACHSRDLADDERNEVGPQERHVSAELVHVGSGLALALLHFDEEDLRHERRQQVEDRTRVNKPQQRRNAQPERHDSLRNPCATRNQQMLGTERRVADDQFDPARQRGIQNEGKLQHAQCQQPAQRVADENDAIVARPLDCRKDSLDRFDGTEQPRRIDGDIYVTLLAQLLCLALEMRRTVEGPGQHENADRGRTATREGKRRTDDGLVAPCAADSISIEPQRHERKRYYDVEHEAFAP